MKKPYLGLAFAALPLAIELELRDMDDIRHADVVQRAAARFSGRGRTKNKFRLYRRRYAKAHDS